MVLVDGVIIGKILRIGEYQDEGMHDYITSARLYFGAL